MSKLAMDPDDPALGGNIVGGDAATFHPALWSFLIERFAVDSVLDVGCGEGHCVRYFYEKGIPAFGFDGLKANVDNAVFPIALHDLRCGPFVMPVALAHCCEVVEHIEERYLNNVLQTLANGRLIAMTHALPGQGGYHHVNCQSSDYWIDRIEPLGFRYLPEVTQQGRAAITASGSWTYFVKSGLIFQRV
ncbi:MAG: methyltransferase domain-containing protein [Planctomycetota bacterium]|nr:MAG: methyltransferase domain-containing protein [Planctomycetota bacterium]REK28414.1 MAG: methyltransferase domain-containing protein [Planctomycetota bacterium]REK48430.1 MAG: methyltransferase domain-containing protein [Planctomycetota bacterium]